jgi:hypothetical protein
MRRTVAYFCLALAVACGGGDSPSAPTQTSVAGTWTLQSINGTNLPFVIAQTGANKAEVMSDVVTAVASGSYTQMTQVRVTQNGQASMQSFSEAGSWTLNGSAASFRRNSDGSVGTASVSGNTLTLAEDGFAYVYKRQ